MPEMVTHTRNTYKPRILVIDDEHAMCVAIRGMLEYHRFHVFTVTSAEDGIRFLEENPDTDIVLLDIDLGGMGMDGLVALPLIRQRFRQIQIIMFTSQNRLDVGVECMKKGAFDYLTKPFDEEAFLRLVPAALERKKTAKINELYFNVIIHDLKNPLQCIIGCHEFVREILNESTVPFHKRLLETADNGIRQMQMMIQNILTVTRFENGSVALNAEEFSIGEQLNQCMATFDGQIKFNYMAKHGNHHPSLVCDRELFTRIISNVLANGVRFSPPDAVITVELDEHENAFDISITNQGSFIPEDMREVVFDKFSGVQPGTAIIRGQNFGLGLTFSKMAVEALGGAISVSGDEAGQLTTFLIQIPKKQPICGDVS